LIDETEPQPKRRGPKPESSLLRRQGKRQDIIEVTAKLMQAHGYNGVTLKSLASEMNVTEPALYHYFDSKQDLLFVIVQQTIDNVLEKVTGLVQQAIPSALKLQQVLLLFSNQIIEQMPMFATYFQDRGELSQERSAEIRTKERHLIHLIADVIAQGMETGEFRKEADPLVTAFALIGASAWVYRWYDPAGRISPEDLSRQIAAVGLNGCLTDKGRELLESQN
jgi:TetR/AcrR family transcriptional regulator, cholesterol catabolism regulator